MDLPAALSGLSTAIGLTKLAVEARDDSKAQQALTEVNAKLVALSISALALAESNRALSAQVGLLENELHKLKLAAEDRERHTLTELRPGAYAYATKPVEEGHQPQAPYLCQPCYDKAVKAVLQFHQGRPGVLAHYTCPEGGAPHTIAIPGTALPDSGPRTISRGFRSWEG